MSCNAEDGPSALLWASVMAHCRGAAALAVASVSAAARDAVECSEGGFFLRGGSVLVAVRPRAVSLDFVEPLWNERERHIPLYHSLVRPAVPTRVMLCVNVGSEVCGEGGDDDDTWQESVPRALEASRWWLMWRTRAWGVPLAVRCLDTLAADVARDFLSHFRAGAVAALKVVVMQRRDEVALCTPRPWEGVNRPPYYEWRFRKEPLDVCLGPVLQEDATGAPWYEGLEELVVRAGLAFSAGYQPLGHLVGHVGLCCEDDTAAPLHAPCLVRLVVEHATAASWIGELGALEELMLPAPEFTDGWDSLGELHALRRLSIEDAEIPKFSWLAGCPELEEVFLTRVRSVQDWRQLAQLPALKQLCLEGTECKDAGVMRKLKNLQVFAATKLVVGIDAVPAKAMACMRTYCGPVDRDTLRFLCTRSYLAKLDITLDGAELREEELHALPDSLEHVRLRYFTPGACTGQHASETSPWLAWYSRLPELTELVVLPGNQPAGERLALMTVLGCPSLAGVQGWHALAPLPAKLRTLRLSHVDFTSGTVVPNAPGGWGEVVRFLAAAPCLEELRLKDCAGIEALAGLCDAMPCLRSLTFEWCVMPSEPSWLGRGDSPTLEYLQISLHPYMGSYINLAPIGTLPALKVFVYKNAWHYDSYMEAHEEELREFLRPKIDLGFLRGLSRTLEVLWLKLTDVGLEDESVLGCLTRLKTLRMEQMHIETFDWLHGCLRLEHLFLGHFVGTDGARQGFAAVANLSQLRLLEMPYAMNGGMTHVRSCCLLETIEEAAASSDDLVNASEFWRFMPHIRFPPMNGASASYAESLRVMCSGEGCLGDSVTMPGSGKRTLFRNVLGC